MSYILLVFVLYPVMMMVGNDYKYYGRTLVIRISIIRTLGYLNAIMNQKSQKSEWFLDLLGLLYYSTVDRKDI